MAVETERDIEFLKNRTDVLLAETWDETRSWERVRSNLASTRYRVYVPSDGEDFEVVIQLKKNKSGRFVLFSHETGAYGGTYTMRSDEYKPLEELGELVF
jgi:hypothetical protein